jgi:heme O synthase-like polyprenyltransferase
MKMKNIFSRTIFRDNLALFGIFIGYSIACIIFFMPIIFSSVASVASLAFTKKQIFLEKIFNKSLLILPIFVFYGLEFYILLISYSVAILTFYTFHYFKHKNIDFQTAHLWILSIIYLPLFIVIEIFYVFISIFI